MQRLRTFPDTLLIILVLLLLFIGLTWVVPAGSFERAELNGRSVIVPGSYTQVEAQPQGITSFFTAPMEGFIGAAQIIAFVFLVGGAFSILTATGAVDAGLQSIIRWCQHRPSAKVWILPLVIILFSLAGATFGMSEEVLVFILITIPLAEALGYDRMVGLAISFVGAGVGFAGAFLNPFTIGVAQGIAELPPGSGLGYRLIVWTVFTVVGVIYIMQYARQVEKDPTIGLSPVATEETSANTQKELDFTNSRKLILWSLLASIGVLIYGVNTWGWYINEIAGLFIGLGILSAFLGRLSGEEAVQAFKHGAKEMMTAALVIGLAKGLIVVAEAGQIIDTILYGMSQALDGLPAYLTVEAMFVLQSLLNFFIPSGSGQAALTMPILAPLSDLLSISRQTAVLAYQFGDGLSNMIIPTSGVTMGALAIAKIPYQVWLKWMLPLFLVLVLVGALLLLPPLYLFTW